VEFEEGCGKIDSPELTPIVTWLQSIA